MEQINKVSKEISLLGGISALISWDEKTYMPKQGITNRAEQLGLLQSIMYDKLTQDKLYKNLINKKPRDRIKRLIVQKLLKDIRKIRKIPSSFVVEMTKKTVIAGQKWEQARQKNDFKLFLPYLEELIRLNIRKAGMISKKTEPYDILLDDYEEGMSEKRLTEIFSVVGPRLSELLAKIKRSPDYRRVKQLRIKADEEYIRKHIIYITEKMGISYDKVNLSVSAHPFTTKIGPDDVRITTRYLDPVEALSSSVHEAGHALYELGIPKELENTVLGQAASVGLHESQSRFWENMIFKNRLFWDKYYSRFKSSAKTDKKTFYESLNMVRPSYIRVDADEVTYPLHIIIRFEIERDLINGKLKAKDAKEKWNKRFHELFGLKVRNDNQGILQDVHWSLGAFGYFPTYALGTIYSTQLYKKIIKIKGIKQDIKDHRFERILKWLRDNIHSKARTMVAHEIIKKATGNGLDINDYIDYLDEKYSEIYR